ncbi:uncharacterized protein AB675_3727 [Cyphellophora attinorum]|uniref:Uncharacterized protein n=1 Tax=Cyphellophora attinorum TaxID=1664694 RepID=A0A0N1HHH6_9EURO|nr:uncharacterized protein AB675_3727 [Phialophora attinorum]KPI35227.1 hypothetical protein AB675_3727 [Phialophora attinorum]
MSEQEQTLYEQYSRPPIGPKFKIGDTVHVLDEAVRQPPAGVTSKAPARASTDRPTRVLGAFPATSSTGGPARVSIPASTSVDEYIRETTWEITAINKVTAEERGERAEHTYRLEPKKFVQVIVPESRLLPVKWLPDDIVKDSSGFLYKVAEVTFHRLPDGSVGRKYVVKSETGGWHEFGDGEAENADSREWFPIEE